MKLEPEAALEKISSALTALYGDRLQCLVAYGSAAGGNHRHRRSDINLLAVLDDVDAATLDAAASTLLWWRQQGNPPVVMLSRAEQEHSPDVFPIEYLDIQSHHRLLHGEDLFVQPVRPDLHRHQIEHELRGKLLRLRAAYLALGQDAKGLEAVMLDSVNAFLTLFRHALVGLGEPFVVHKDHVLAAAAARFQFSPAPFAAILEARSQGRRIGADKLDAVRALFADYLAAIQQVERVLEQAHAQSPV